MKLLQNKEDLLLPTHFYPGVNGAEKSKTGKDDKNIRVKIAREITSNASEKQISGSGMNLWKRKK